MSDELSSKEDLVAFGSLTYEYLQTNLERRANEKGEAFGDFLYSISHLASSLSQCGSVEGVNLTCMDRSFEPGEC